ncbi:methyl-accepting chemotaxis protein [Rubeoparvulum massiliense]|uniref:methyl-accepting chemotaxis protein n=1 Tax=Rubeoparvulum massiliense TaxID=1631346 RepID=UPI00065E99C1|nr:methyl-accepting chemotaxis protein [Rubeoparvulum massiliense]
MSNRKVVRYMLVLMWVAWAALMISDYLREDSVLLNLILGIVLLVLPTITTFIPKLDPQTPYILIIGLISYSTILTVFTEDASRFNLLFMMYYVALMTSTLFYKRGIIYTTIGLSFFIQISFIFAIPELIQSTVTMSVYVQLLFVYALVSIIAMVQGKLGRGYIIDAEHHAEETAVQMEKVESLLSNLKDGANEVDHEVDQFTEEGNQLQEISGQVLQAIREIAKGAEHQTESINDAVNFLRQVVERIERVAEETAHVNEVASGTSQRAGESSQQMDELSEKMQQNGSMIEAINQATNALSHKIVEVSGLLASIKDVAEQTNLLALNASIEAAHAGEHGRSFAVVAEEIRKLAEQTNRLAQNIQEGLGEVGERMHKMEERAQEGITVTTASLEMVGEAKGSFDNIVQSIQVLVEQVEHTTDETQEIKKFSDKVLAEFDNLSAIVEEASASAEEVTASAEEQQHAIEHSFGRLERIRQLVKSWSR